MRFAAACLSLCLASAAVEARQRPPREPGGGRAQAADEAFKMVDAYLVSNLQESLGLTDEQFVKILPLVKKRQDERRGFVQRRMRTLGELKRILESGAATESRVGDLLRELKALETEEPAALRKSMDAIDASLSPVQQAKFRIMEIEVERKIRALMMQLRSRGPRGDGGGPDRDPRP